MVRTQGISVAIVDYGLGNLFSVKHACQHVGMQARITSLKEEITAADAIFLPGVGAFGDAMASLRQLGLVDVLRDQASVGKPLVGICLGMQLLMSESEEFGRYEGLNIVEGTVVRFRNPKGDGGTLKVPQVGWNRVFRPARDDSADDDPWRNTPLDHIDNGTFLYFVHSYYPIPTDASLILSVTRYGDVDFCSSLQHGNIFASQFHPERSGPDGLHIYHNVAAWIRSLREE